MNKTINGTILVLVTLVLSACGGSIQTYNAGPVQRTAPNQMNEVVFVDHELNRTKVSSLTGTTHQTIRVSVDSKGIRSTQTGTAEVWAVLRNHTDYPQQVKARTMFYDNSQAPIDVAPQWKKVYIPPNSQGVYKELSTRSDVAFYRVEISGAP